MTNFSIYILYTKSKELWLLNFVSKIYTKVCWNVGYILYTKVYWNVGYILYTFCIQKFVEMWDTFCIQTLCQAFIQAVLLMSIFWTKIEFSNNVKCRLGSWGGVSSIMSSWWSPARGSGSKVPEKFFGLFVSGGQINSLK